MKPHDEGSPPRRAGRAALPILAALLAGVGVGWLARTLTPSHPGHPALPAPPPALSGDTPQVAEGGDTRSVEGADEALRLWSTLAWSLASRTRDLEALLEEIAADSGDPRAAIDRAIAASSDRELAAVVSAVTRIDEDTLLEQGDLRPFAGRLVEVALDGLGGPSDEPPPDHPVFFTTSTRDFDPDADAERAFPADQGRIFAMVDPRDYAGERIMVKWANKETGRIHSLQSMPFQPGRPLWSYLGRDGNWEPGDYQVSFYGQDARMQLIGRGEYTVF